MTALIPGFRVPRLSALAHGRDNNFQLLRLLAAAFVVLFHSYALTDRWTHEPLWRLAPELNFGALGVKIFFVISGFLVTQSWLARRSPLPFAAARALRIYPALIAATLFTIVLAGVSSALPWTRVPRAPADASTTRGASRSAGRWSTGCRAHSRRTRSRTT